MVARNTPTLINAALQPAQFADARAVTLEDQVIEVLRSPAEMGSSIERAASWCEPIAPIVDSSRKRFWTPAKRP